MKGNFPMKVSALKLVPAVICMLILLVTGCQSAPTQRHPAASPEFESALIRKFVRALTTKSALRGESAVEGALSDVVSENVARLHLGSRINSLDDLSSLSETEQRRVIEELATLPGFAERLEVSDLNAVEAARVEAMSAQEVKGVSTESVPGLSGEPRPELRTESQPSFAKILEHSPSLKSDVDLLLRENSEIEKKPALPFSPKDAKAFKPTNPSRTSPRWSPESKKT
jgi:hypothetical protein